MTNSPTYVVVIGASAGGISALKKLVRTFERGIDAAICIVLHMNVLNETRFLVQQLQANTTFTCEAASDQHVLQKDHIYVALADKHLLIDDKKLLVGHGPKENRWRPSIDALFRSAAAHYSNRAIGIILTGLLDDGVSGMIAIKKSKGKCIVLDPAEAEYPDMPNAVLEHLRVDYRLPMSEIFPVLKKITRKKTRLSKPPADVVAESRISERTATGVSHVEPLGANSVYSCPDCGGNLWSIKDRGIERYRCHIGHTFTEQQLILNQVQTIESTLWTALRMMEERRHLLTRIHAQQIKRGHKRLAAITNEQSQQMDAHIERLKKILFSGQAISENAIEVS